MLLYKQAIVTDLMKTEDGIKLLKRASRKNEPDMDRLMKVFG